MSQISDLVRDSRLETQFLSNNTIHTYFESKTVLNRRARRQKRVEQWVRSRELGRGTFGIVWLEQCDQEDRVRAVKEIAKKEIQEKTYHRELEAIVKFSHPRYDGFFVRSFGWYESPDSVFIAMEYILHGDLRKHLKQALPEDQAGQVVRQVLEGLECMHENGFAHRDLKPENIFVVSKPPDKWWVKIGDFGISKRVEGGATALRTINGTPGFIAPEVALRRLFEVEVDESSYDFTVDLWSLGVIAFYMLTTKLPFLKLEGFLSYSRGELTIQELCSNYKVINEGTSSFLGLLMAPKAKDRGTAQEALQHTWLPKDEDSPPGSPQHNTSTLIKARIATTTDSSSESEPEVSTFTTVKSATLPPHQDGSSSESELEDTGLTTKSHTTHLNRQSRQSEKSIDTGPESPADPTTVRYCSASVMHEPLEAETGIPETVQSEVDASNDRRGASVQLEDEKPRGNLSRISKPAPGSTIKEVSSRPEGSQASAPPRPLCEVQLPNTLREPALSWPKTSTIQKFVRRNWPDKSSSKPKRPDTPPPPQSAPLRYSETDHASLHKTYDPYTSFQIDPYATYPVQPPEKSAVSISRPKRPDTPPPKVSSLKDRVSTVVPPRNHIQTSSGPSRPINTAYVAPAPSIEVDSDEGSSFDAILKRLHIRIPPTSSLDPQEVPTTLPTRIPHEVTKASSRNDFPARGHSRESPPREPRRMRYVERTPSQDSSKILLHDPVWVNYRGTSHHEKADSSAPVEFHRNSRSRSISETEKSEDFQIGIPPMQIQNIVRPDGYTQLDRKCYSEDAFYELGIYHTVNLENSSEILAYGTFSNDFYLLLRRLTLEMRSTRQCVRTIGDVGSRTTSCLSGRTIIKFESIPTNGRSTHPTYKYELEPVYWCGAQVLKYTLPPYQTCVFTIVTSTGLSSQWSLSPYEIRPEILKENNIDFAVQNNCLTAEGHFSPGEVNSLLYNTVMFLRDVEDGRKSLSFDTYGPSPISSWSFPPRKSIHRVLWKSPSRQGHSSRPRDIYCPDIGQRHIGSRISEIDYETFDENSIFRNENHQYLHPQQGINPFDGMLFLAREPTSSFDPYHPDQPVKHIEIERIYHPSFPSGPPYFDKFLEFERHYHRSNLYVYKRVLINP